LLAAQSLPPPEYVADAKDDVPPHHTHDRHGVLAFIATVLTASIEAQTADRTV
jgi:hypothetical protein